MRLKNSFSKPVLVVLCIFVSLILASSLDTSAPHFSGLDDDPNDLVGPSMQTNVSVFWQDTESLLDIGLLYSNSSGTWSQEKKRRFYNPWNISSAVYNGKNITSQEVSYPSGFFISYNGTRMYEISSLNDRIYRYSFSTPWDITSAVYTGSNISSRDSDPSGIFFHPNGTYMYEVGMGNDSIYQYSLSDPWNISTAQYTVNISTQDDRPSDVFIGANGTRLYEIGLNDRIRQYNLSDPWNISTAQYTGKTVLVNLIKFCSIISKEQSSWY